MAVVIVAPAPSARAAESVDRAAGNDRVTTAVDVSSQNWEEASNALLANRSRFTDALSAGALANRLDAPLLLTSADELPDAVADELSRLGVDTVYVLGGADAVSPEVESALADRGYSIERIQGANRYETARNAALASGPSGTDEVALALGEHPERPAWPDAVSAGALAAIENAVPTLLTRPSELPDQTAQALGDLDAEKVLLIGGPRAVEPAVAETLRTRGYNVERIAGSNRYATSAAVAAEALSRTTGEHQAVFASGESFPDALSAGSLAGHLGAPLVLVQQTQLPGTAEQLLRANAADLNGGTLVGGTHVASKLVRKQAAAARADEQLPARSLTQEPSRSSERQSDESSTASADSAPEVVRTFTGEASWYGPRFAGQQTASGEIFNPNEITAAHKSLPFGTRVRVTNVDTGDQVIVRITDRGPYAAGRVLDLSRAAAAEAGYYRAGSAFVRAEVLAN
jgi:putative cell wall-binding protein